MDKIKSPKEEPQEKIESQPTTVEEYQKKWDQMLQDTAKQIDKIPVVQPSLPLDVVAHNATVILSGVLLGALLAFVTSHLGWLRHHVRLNDRLVNAIFPLGPQVFFFTLPLWFIVALRPAVRFSVLIMEYATVICQSLMAYIFPVPEYNDILESSIKIPAQMTKTWTS
ncbi:hypothetical protein PEX2_036920 [Penicillium expansum]|uniref:Uncharacterized protein n=1 Tax=Penicillium expansum TaxID=27334 RepID=A0A0A2J6X8_PENEN|nr:hypothetical protein PEX2_036920 [Penicillium expansum]KGO50521.1 hypothetical protein PEX2_036920 [Penicillium expansum]